ncbi:MAG: Stp1/IreP family PP2C-type Ser/Thr phosphatase [Actinomycetota bacterium]
MKLAVGARTDVGQVREGNEDSYLANAPVFAVADGMGGHIAGDIASAIAVEVIQNEAGDFSADDPDTLATVLKDANAEIYQRSSGDESLRGMGTTCTLMLVDGTTAQIAHVGDSRAYLLRDGELRQVTEDHTLVGRMVSEGRLKPEDAQHHPQRSIITRALGVDSEVEVDVVSLDLHDGDRLLLCSDGLSSMVEPSDIRDALASDPDPQRVADSLVERANAAGGDDNITVVVVFAGAAQVGAAPPVTDAAAPPTGPRADTDPAEGTDYHRAVEVTPKRRRWPRRVALGMVVVALLGGAAYGATRYALSNSWFVGVNDDGRVAIYRGIPDEIAGVSLKEEHDTSDVQLESLPEFRRDEVRRGIPVDSLAEAQETVTNLTRLAQDEEFGPSSRDSGNQL